MRFNNGDIYEGNFIQNKIQGQGKYTWATKDFYEGEFENG